MKKRSIQREAGRERSKQREAGRETDRVGEELKWEKYSLAFYTDLPRDGPGLLASSWSCWKITKKKYKKCNYTRERRRESLSLSLSLSLSVCVYRDQSVEFVQSF